MAHVLASILWQPPLELSYFYPHKKLPRKTNKCFKTCLVTSVTSRSRDVPGAELSRRCTLVVVPTGPGRGVLHLDVRGDEVVVVAGITSL